MPCSLAVHYQFTVDTQYVNYSSAALNARYFHQFFAIVSLPDDEASDKDSCCRDTHADNAEHLCLSSAASLLVCMTLH